ncbi:MAG: hypothetical protein HYR70_02975 [Chloroflexi bacterium]|nr:hypothetical protein [Chloroflexota bacterium]MBI3339972.1 hypothetical protein [Chloroflexota bacterium]
MTRRAIFLPGLFAILLTMISMALLPATSSRAAESAPPPGPDRVSTITVDYTAYEWWMAAWRKNSVACSIIVDHEGQPTLGEVYRDCNAAVYNTWKTQKPCIDNICAGYYLYLVQTRKSQREMTVKLPPPTVTLSLENCAPVSRSGTNICESTPTLVLTGQEPLPNERIRRIEGTMDGTPFTCDPICKLRLAPTDDNGVRLEFWAWSSYGDSSPVFTGQVRVAIADENNPDQYSWYVDVLSSQWQGVPNASCSETWGTFPPVGGPPDWLSTPKDPSELSSDIPYNYLSANLILQGVVDASGCPDGGLLPDGGANQCGLDAARSQVDAWQNQFDSLILDTSQNTGVPAKLLKNLFARESQFWPGVFKASTDAGLGQLTENGADTALLWNPSFYNQYCPLVLSSESCSKGYLHLKEKDQLLLRQALVGSVNAACDNCPLGIDLSQANFSVAVFAQTLLASCEQTGQIIQNNTGQLPGDAASYEDLWKFTLVNYNAGAGCLGLAVNETWNAERKLTWDAMSTRFTDVCAPAANYVSDISK